MDDELTTIQEGTGFYTDADAWPNSADHGNGTYGPRSYAPDAEGTVELESDGVHRARADADFVSSLMGY